MLIVRAGLARVAQLLEVVHDVAPDVAQRDLPLLGQAPHELDELLAPLLGELGDLQADDRAVVVRRQAEVGLHDRPLDRLDRALVVGLHGDQPRLGRVDRRQLPQRREGSVVVDADAVQQTRARAPGTDGVELLARGLHGLVHVLARVLKEFVDHVVTSVPTRSPEIIRLMLASSAMLKTWMGSLLSMHSASALESITRRSRCSASRAVISGMNSADGSLLGSAVKMPSTPFLAISSTSAFISIARSAAAVSE